MNMSIAKKNSVNIKRDESNVASIPEVQIGMGYSDTTQMGTSTFCVNSSHIELHGKPISVIGFGSSMNFRQTQQDLGIDLTANVSIDKFSGNLVAQYGSSIKDTSYSISYSFVYKIQLPTRIVHVDKFGPDALSSFGLGVFQEAQKNGNLDRFLDVCGNKFAVQETSGAKLYTTLTVDFDSKYDKSKFALGFKGSISDIGSAVLDISQNATSTSLSGTISLSAVQMGGNVMRLAQIFGRDSRGEDNNILKCRLTEEDVKNCANVVGDIIDYAKSDFANQITFNSTTGDVIGTPTSLEFTYLEYDKIGIDNAHVVDNKTITEIRAFLGKTDDDAMAINTYLNKLLYTSGVTGLMDYAVYKDNQTWSGKWHWDPQLVAIEQKAELLVSYQNANTILNAVRSQYSGAIQCYKEMDTCFTVRDYVNSTIINNPIAYDTINFLRKPIYLTPIVMKLTMDLGFYFP